MRKLKIFMFGVFCGCLTLLFLYSQIYEDKIEAIESKLKIEEENYEYMSNTCGRDIEELREFIDDRCVCIGYYDERYVELLPEGKHLTKEQICK